MVSLEVAEAPIGVDKTVVASSSSQPEGNENHETAVNWMVERRNDADIDEIPLVPANSKVQVSQPSVAPDEMKFKAQDQELKEYARKMKKEEEEKRVERESEKGSVGKRVNKKGRSLQKEKKALTHSPKIAPQQASSSVGAGAEGPAVTVSKEKKLCAHFEKGFNLDNLSEKLGSSNSLRCEDCREGVADRKGRKGKGKHGKKKGLAHPKSESKAIWICLVCGHFSCGGVGLPTMPQSHAIRHAKQARHPMVIQWENPHLRWCFQCSMLIPVEIMEETGVKKDPLLDVVKLIKTPVMEGSSMDVEEVWFGGGSVSGEIKANSTRLIGKEGRNGYAIRGLVNLGNTCFFNSVMQNLLAMDKLRDVLLNEDVSFGPLTIALKKLFTETQQETGTKNAINPKSFFGSICSKAPQFRGYQQQDSHELLRCLLDGLSSEELAMGKQVNCCKENGPSLEHRTTFVDSIFGGRVSSTVSCIECRYSSTMYEPFLDLSLPVPNKKPPTKKSQSVSKPQNKKAPPKRGGTVQAKANKDTDSVPTRISSSTTASCRSLCQTQPKIGHAENAVASSSDDVAMDPVRLTPATDKSGSPLHNSSAITNTKNQQVGPDTVKQTAVSFDLSWMDYLGEEATSNEHDFNLQNKDVPTGHSSGFVENDQSCAVDGGPNVKFESSVNPWEEEAPLQVKSSEVLLLPYKEESSIDGHITKGEDEASSAVGCNQDELEFDGFGDLFNEPEVSSGPAVGPSLVNGTTGIGFTTANGSESDPDEVDNSDSPVSVESCLAHFVKPELLSNDNAWECDNCSKAQLRQRLKAKKKSTTIVETTINGGETQIPSRPTSDKDNLGSTEIRDLYNGDSKPDSGSLVADNERSDQSTENCMKTENGQIDEIIPVISQGDEQKGEMTTALVRQFESSATYKSCSQESFSSPVVSSSNIDEPSSTAYATAEDQTGDSQYSENCGANRNEGEEGTRILKKVKRDATKRVLIDQAPPILTVHLKRFSQDVRGRFSKLNGHVNFGDVLDLRPYIDPRCDEREKFVYRLLGVVEHLGTMRGGHYVAYVRGSEKSKDNGGSVWYHASDTYVREVSLQEVLRCEAYILFYEKI